MAGKQGTLGSQRNPVPHLALARYGVLCVAALAVLTLAGCHTGPGLTEQQAHGQHLYMVHCAHCHEENDLGLRPPPDIRGAMQRRVLPSGAPATDAEIRRLLLAGKGKMPSFSGRFTVEEIAALTAYLKSDMPLAQP